MLGQRPSEVVSRESEHGTALWVIFGALRVGYADDASAAGTTRVA